MGFSISEIVQGSKYKNLMKYVYGWGAAVVLLGALFKLQHYPGAGLMLLIGMITEAIIFFLSAFEPIVEEVDWTIVYPELAGITDEVRKPKDKGGVDMVMLESIITSAISKSNISVKATLPAEPAAKKAETKPEPRPVQQPQVVQQAQPVQQVMPQQPVQPVIVQQAPMVGGMVFTEKFNEMLEKAEIGPELFMKIGHGLERLSEASNGIAKISAAVASTERMSENMERASEAVGKFAGNYEESGALLARKAKVLADSFEKTSTQMSDTGQAFSASFKDIVQQAANKLSAASNNVDKGVTEAGVQLASMNKNLAALNAAHDVQLQNIQARLKANDEVNKKVEEMLKQMLEKASEDTSRYSKSVSQLADNVFRLNSVYGNMLSAMGTLANR